MKQNAILRKIDEETPDLIRFVQELVQAKSITGEEGKLAQPIIASTLKQLGFKVDSWTISKQEFEGKVSLDEYVPANEDFNSYRTNVVGVIGDARDSSLCFNGHIDTVPEGNRANWKHDPYGGELRDGKIFGRGTCDMKAGLAASIFAIKMLVEAGSLDQNSGNSSIMIQSVCGEESGGLGTLSAILRGYVANETVVCEPTELRIKPAQCGCLDFKLTIEGKSAHGAMRDYGVNAIEKFMPIFQSLLKLEARRKRARRHPLFKDSKNVVPLSIGKVAAGNWDSTVPEELVAEGRYGVWPGEELDSARKEFEIAVRNSSKKDSWLSKHPPRIEWVKPEWQSAEISPNHQLVLDLQQAFKTATGFKSKVGGSTGGTDMRLFTNLAKKPALIFGPGEIQLAHFTDEHVKVSDVVKACKSYAMLVLQRVGA